MKKIDGKTEREFLEWLYTVIGDDNVDYMWAIAGRIGELKAKESADNVLKLSESNNPGFNKALKEHRENWNPNFLKATQNGNKTNNEM